MSAQPNTETITLDDRDYIIKTRLGWQEQSRIEASAFKIFIDGKQIGSLNGVKGIEDIPEIEVRMDPTMQNTMRLQSRLVNVPPRQVPLIPARHVKALIARIVELESEEAAEEEALQPASPFEKPLRESVTAPSSSG